MTSHIQCDIFRHEECKSYGVMDDITQISEENLGDQANIYNRVIVSARDP